MSKPTESRTFHQSKEPRPLFDRFKLLVEKAELSRLQDDASLKTRPDFGMTVPPVAERRVEQRSAERLP